MKDLYYIFFTFLKIGATAFGGYMSLIAVVQKQLVEIDKKLSEEDLLDGISLTSVLPGPVAVNVVAYVGYRLKGVSGAIAAFAGIIIPSFFLVLALSWFYFTYGNIPAVKDVFSGITPAVTALILTVAVGMARKNVKEIPQWVICILSALLLIFIGGFTTTFLLLLCSGIAGYFLFNKPANKEASPQKGKDELKRRHLLVSGICILLLLCILIWGGQYPDAPRNLQVLSTFSGISLTLFGGGYVVIPALHELFVDNLHWLTSAEFADGIAIGQITPGPIFITATFIGYKVSGITGAALATLAIFTPPAVLTVVLSRYVAILNRSSAIKASMKGIRPAVIGMIFASTVMIGRTVSFSIPALLIFLLTILISVKYNVSPIYLILGAGVAGLLLF